MRRKWAIVIAGIAVLGVFATLMWALLTPAQDFRFLEGRKPLRQSTSLAYVFESESSGFLQQAKEELLERGYAVSEKTSDGAAIKASGSTGVIDIFDSAKWECTDDGNMCYLSAGHDGWVTVIFWGESNASLLNWIRSILASLQTRSLEGSGLLTISDRPKPSAGSRVDRRPSPHPSS